MPNRILREDIITSDRVNSLDWAAEVFYRRLMSVVDDYGRFDGRAAVIRAKLYPLQLDRVKEADIRKYLEAIAGAGLIRLYEVEEKPYLELLRFRQRVRASDSKYPPPPANDRHMTVTRPSHDRHVRSSAGLVEDVCAVVCADVDVVDVCSEPLQAAVAEPALPPLMDFPTRGPIKTWPLTQAKADEYGESYHGLDVIAECRKARQWCLDNAGKRKTARGMPAFLSRWLANAVDRPKRNGHDNGHDDDPTGEKAAKAHLDKLAIEVKTLHGAIHD